MASLDQIKSVISKIVSIDELGKHICFFGGAIPYIYYGEESNRDHSDIDILVEKEYLDTIRKILIEHQIYREKYDSLKLGLDKDYGFKVWIDDVYVEFEPMVKEGNVLNRFSFSPNKEIAGTEMIPFENIEDLMIPVKIGGKDTFFQSAEYIKACKEKYGRDKDLIDSKFISSMGIDEEKYERCKKVIESTKDSIISYGQSKKELDEMLDSNNIENDETKIETK